MAGSPASGPNIGTDMKSCEENPGEVFNSAYGIRLHCKPITIVRRLEIGGEKKLPAQELGQTLLPM